jgi:hypothetical protein
MRFFSVAQAFTPVDRKSRYPFPFLSLAPFRGPETKRGETWVLVTAGVNAWATEKEQCRRVYELVVVTRR